MRLAAVADMDLPCFLLDANCVNARQLNGDLNQLERWYEDGSVTLLYPEVTYAEARHRSAMRAEKVDRYTWVELLPEHDNPEVERAIEHILFPQGVRTLNERNDVRAVYYAQRLAYPLVTMDGGSKKQPGGILGRAFQLAAELDVEVIPPSAAVACARRRLPSI